MTAPQFANPVESALLRRAATGDATAFDKLTKPHLRPLHVHCYRMLGSPFDADDALQETLLAAWRGIGSFEGRSAFGTWLVSIASRICLRMISRRPRRLTSSDYGAPLRSTSDLGAFVPGPVWLEPIPDGELVSAAAGHDDPAATLLRSEHIGLAFVALLQHLPATQRAALLLSEVFGYSAAETASILNTSTASINSALQRARKTIKAKSPGGDPAEKHPVDEQQLNRLLRAFVAAWEQHDLTAMLDLLTEDVRFTMPPLPAWFSGRGMVEKFFAERVFETPWRLHPLGGNGQFGFACYQQQLGDDRFRPGGVVLLRVQHGRIGAIESFLDPAVCRRFGMLDPMP
jgi:RNA polymerase sigma-70 factor (TIGR02960 family)